ncbi:MBL fold metallo-hydrolase [Candidatus Bathyarchaeota archaeon]|nr:MBL fold metallo-hydrolase [Candidatus Bathyarchaeota archaeon]
MNVTKIDEHIYMIDVEAGEVRNFIASYVLIGEKVALVETGPTSSIPNLLDGLEELNVKPEDVAYVAVSHIHLDHGGGVGKLVKHLPKAKVIVHQRGAPHLVNPEKLWQQSQLVLGEIAEIYGEPEPVPAERLIAASDGMTVDVGDGVSIRVVETLGHASHHLSYYAPFSNGVFTGDAAGIYLSEIGVIVPTTPPPFRLDIALASLDKLANLRPKTLYYTHFGKASDALEKLRFYAEQLKLWASIAKKAIENGDTIEAIGQKIVEGDKAVKKAEDYLKKHKVLSETTLKESVQGVVEYVKNLTS